MSNLFLFIKVPLQSKAIIDDQLSFQLIIWWAFIVWNDEMKLIRQFYIHLQFQTFAGSS